MKIFKLYRVSSKRKISVSMLMLLLVLIVGFVPSVSVLSQDEPLDLGNLSPGISAPTEPVTITFASWVGGGGDWQALAQQFNELYPNITIEFQDVPFEEIRTKLLTQVAANNPPDVAYLDLSTIGEFGTRGALTELNAFIEQSNAIDLDDYVPAFLQAVMSEGGVYGLPIRSETTGLFYRTDLFEE